MFNRIHRKHPLHPLPLRAALSTEAPGAVPLPSVQSASLAASLRLVFRTLQQHALGVHRDERFAGPHREKMWDAAMALLDARPRGTDQVKLRAPLQALRSFVSEFCGLRDSGDRQLQTRIFSGYSSQRPGLTRLLEDVLVAAGMGRVTTLVDHAGEHR